MKIAASVCARNTPTHVSTSNFTAGVINPRQLNRTFGAPNDVPISAVYGGWWPSVKNSLVYVMNPVSGDRYVSSECDAADQRASTSSSRKWSW